MNKLQLVTLAEKFLQMHHAKEMFLLPNAWNGGSAKVFEKQGFPAIGTTSAGIAYAAGYADGEKVSFEKLLQVTKEIVEVTSIPVSIDIERGYGDSPTDIKENVRKIIQAGAVGINIEDGDPENNCLESLDLQIQKIQALSELKEELEIPFVINARTCAFWLKIYQTNEIEKIIDRCNAFVEAGADCIFVPGALDAKTVRLLSQKIKAPLNTIANPIFNDFEKLENLGVKRLSIGSGAVRTVFSNLIHLAQEMKKKDLHQMFNHDFSYQNANQYFSE